ncbi:hypothetical protein SASPL_124517 [Salvia splendens]|uniref:Uncharacterized protein n=1 Tax=Salvia splendens TaxID=180675 RepID=A0A8X8XFY5_SALSN|nr:hypothetical protein SASPL_124517 [Salvia splendens]
MWWSRTGPSGTLWRSSWRTRRIACRHGTWTDTPSLRSDMRERAYLGQQLYFSVVSPEHSLRDEYNLPLTQLLCGIVKANPNLALYT